MSLRFYRFVYCLMYPITHLFFPVRYHHRERLPETGPMMICASHSHIVDPLLLVYLLGWRRPLRFMAKKELLDMPILGAILRGIGSFGVDRGHADMGAIRASMDVLKNGAVMIAARTEARIVPVYIPRKKRLFHRLDVVVGEAYRLDRSLRGKEAYAEKAGELMSRIEALKEAS